MSEVDMFEDLTEATEVKKMKPEYRGLLVYDYEPTHNNLPVSFVSNERAGMEPEAVFELVLNRTTRLQNRRLDLYKPPHVYNILAKVERDKFSLQFYFIFT